jgi:hypothetical protein
MKQLVIILVFFFSVIPLRYTTGQVEDINKLKTIYEEIKQICAKDNGKLWGKEIYGALMFVDPETRNIVTNEQDPGKTLTEKDGLFLGKLDETANVANTAMNWKGKNWTMVMLPLSKNVDSKRALIIHELFHNIEDQLGLGISSPMPNHLEKKDARILLRLEWNALMSSLTDSDKKRKYHIESALIFRNMRRSIYPGAILKENGFELVEGLAEYTGIVLGIENDVSKMEYLRKHLKSTLEEAKSFVRSFAYMSGALYGLALDKSGKNWRNELPINADLGNLISKNYSICLTVPSRIQVDRRKNNYGFSEIEKSEISREEENKKVAATCKKKFTEDPALYLSNIRMNYQFNPSEVMSIDDLGNMYPTIRVVDKWGILTVEKGALMLNDYSKIIVSAPFTTDSNTLKGDGWNLVLNEGWEVVSYKGNSFTLKNDKEK